MSTNPNDLNLFEKVLSHLSLRDVVILGLLMFIYIIYQDRGMFYEFLQRETLEQRAVGDCLLVIEKDNHYLVHGVSRPLAVKAPDTQLLLMLRAKSNDKLEAEDFVTECEELTYLTELMEDSTVDTPEADTRVTPYQP